MNMSLVSFMMNPTWCSHSKIRYIKDEWVVQVKNHTHVGDVLKIMTYTVAPASPPSPYRLTDSTPLPITDIVEEPPSPNTVAFRRLNAAAEANEANGEAEDVDLSEFRNRRDGGSGRNLRQRLA